MQFLQSFALYKILDRFSEVPLRRILIVGLLVGLCSSLLIALINHTTQLVVKEKSVISEFFIFIPLLVCYLVLIRLNNNENTSNSEGLIYRFKMHTMGLILRADMATLKKIGEPNILMAVANDTIVISYGASQLASTIQSLSVMFFAIFYLFFISMTAGLAVLIFSVVVSVVAIKLMGAHFAMLELARDKERIANGHIAEMLAGFKEIKLHSTRAMEISADLIDFSHEAMVLKKNTLHAYLGVTAGVQTMMYVLIGCVIFIVPILSSSFNLHVVNVTTTVLAISGTMAGMVMTFSLLIQAEKAALSMNSFMDRIEIMRQQSADTHEFPIAQVNSIRLENIVQSLNGETSAPPFVVGPISYEFHAGQVYFIRGNNGSGKTSLIRILTGLSTPESGQIYVNDEAVFAAESQAYRDLFSAIFGDFHLFQRLYGLAVTDENEVNYWLEKLEIIDKVQYNEGKLTTVSSLSTGQRKRVALLVSILEKRPAIILDEWASDQDPEFRKFFYEMIIPELKALKKLVIAITHDDNYFDQADHLLLVDQGRLYANI